MNDSQKHSKILIVDDLRENIDVLRDVLSEYVRMVAMNGVQTLEIAHSRNPPDLILLDIMMPNMDGYEVCRQLKANPNTAGIPVIFLTAKTSIPDEIKGFELGAVDYITKPISPPIVLARVKTHLQLKHTLSTMKQQNETIHKQYLELAETSQLREDVKNIMQQDLKTPLNEIISGVNQIYLASRPYNLEAQPFYSVLKATNQLLTMINVSIEMYKIEKGDYVLKPKPVDLIPILSDIIKFEEKKINLRGLMIKILLNGRSIQPGEKFHIMGEELLCYSMLTNLLQHAMDTTIEMESILIFLEGVNPSILKICYKTKKSAEETEDFFKKYIDNGDRKRLGPYAAKMIAELQKGTITLDSTNNHNIIVIVKLPTGWLEGVNSHR
ncbi:MAG: response regulator [Magnetococcales bacterium]|nr:response regulator [Magnetococcales bacterium]